MQLAEALGLRVRLALAIAFGRYFGGRGVEFEDGVAGGVYVGDAGEVGRDELGGG